MFNLRKICLLGYARQMNINSHWKQHRVQYFRTCIASNEKFTNDPETKKVLSHYKDITSKKNWYSKITKILEDRKLLVIIYKSYLLNFAFLVCEKLIIAVRNAMRNLSVEMEKYELEDESSLPSNVRALLYGVMIKSTFVDIKGLDEAKQQLKKVVDFLKNSEAISTQDEIPKGVLLVGPPGNGKTSLAKAVAGEAGVRYFQLDGLVLSVIDPHEPKMLFYFFSSAKIRMPCVIFIDEIDVGLINKVLNEMDALRKEKREIKIIVIVATSKKDVETVLLESGCFDVIHLNVPDFNDRKELLESYLLQEIQGEAVDVDLVAKSTEGFSRGDLKDMVKLAGIKAHNNKVSFVSMRDLEDARQDIVKDRESRVSESEVKDDDTNKKQ